MDLIITMDHIFLALNKYLVNLSEPRKEKSRSN